MDGKIKLTAGEVIDAAGGTSKVAERFGVTIEAVCAWRRNGLPSRRMLKWQKILDELGISAPPEVFGQK